MILKIRSVEEFERLLNSLSNEAVTANIHFRLYKALIAAQSEFGVAFSQSWTFWSLTIQAHVDTALLHLCRVYDQHDDALSLRNLLDTIEANFHLFDEQNFRERLKDNPFVASLAEGVKRPPADEIKSDRSSVMHSNSLVQSLVVQRGHHIAHRNAQLIANQKGLAERFELTEKGVEELLVNAMRVLNRYNTLFRASSYSTQMIGHDDYRYVLKTIAEHVERQRAEMQRTIEKLKQDSN